jgi:hypothetical protein
MTRIHKCNDIKSWAQRLPQKKKKTLRQAVTCFVFFDIRICVTCRKVRWQWKCSFRWKQHNQRATHTGYVPCPFTNVWGKPLRNYTQTCPKNDYASTEHVTQAVSEVQICLHLSQELFTKQIKGFGVCRVWRRTRHTVQGIPKRSSRGVICLQHISALKMFSAQLQASGFRKLPTVRSQTKCTHFWNFSISSPANGAHFSISHPHNEEGSKIWLQHPSRRSMRLFTSLYLAPS